MPIQHTVVFRLVHPAGSDAERDFLTTARVQLADIPGVEAFAVSRQISPKSDLAWQLSMEFADQDAYDAYDEHPVHTAFVQTRWIPEVAAFQEYDFVTL